MHDSPNTGHAMHREVEWLKPSDRTIMAEIDKYGGWMKPSTIALNQPYTRRHVARRCKVLAEHDLLQRHEETAAYQISELGVRFLNDELEVEDLLIPEE